LQRLADAEQLSLSAVIRIIINDKLDERRQLAGKGGRRSVPEPLRGPQTA
jgi:hypothetical protein